MVGIEDFTSGLKVAIERHSRLLKGGRLFLPKYLHRKTLVTTFGAIVESLAQDLELDLKTEYTNRFPAKYEIDNPQRVDYVLFTKQGNPWLFLELESLDRSQMYLFSDGPVNKGSEDNKLWYYNATLGKSYRPGEATPPPPHDFVGHLTAG